MTFEEDIKKAVDALKRGGIILYPTDTVWGIGCDASNPEAVGKVFALKGRAANKSVLVLVDSEGMLERSVREVPEVAWQLMEAAVNPVTIIYDEPVGICREVCAPDGSVGIRMTSERFSRELCRRLRRPIVSTSANISGSKTPATFSEIPEEVKQGVDYIAEYRREDDTPARPSNIIKLTNSGEVKVIR